ncbi:MAG: VIT domain-containing protein [Planctomycetota bacterium]
MQIERLSEAEARLGLDERQEAGFGALLTGEGALPLRQMDVRARWQGLVYGVELRQTFVNLTATPLEATYVFPLPARAAVHRFRFEVGGRVVEAELQEQERARKTYAQAIEAGQRAALAEEDTPGVFQVKVGNLMPGEEASVWFHLAGPLDYALGELTFRFPLVVAPRYCPASASGAPAWGERSGLVLLPGHALPVQLTLSVDLDPGGLPLGPPRSSLQAVLAGEGPEGARRVELQPGERLDRDFVLRVPVGGAAVVSSLLLAPPPESAPQDAAPQAEGETRDDEAGTFLLTLVPPRELEASRAPRDVVFVLDRSGSMGGWKIVTARRATARMIESLRARDRFALYVFDDVLEVPGDFEGPGLQPASPWSLARAADYLSGLPARGGTEMLLPLTVAADALVAGREPDREQVIVLVTDGQVRDEAAIVSELTPLLGSTRIVTVGIDSAVNAAFLEQLARLSGGRCELVESEERLDEVMHRVHELIDPPVLHELALEARGCALIDEALVPWRMPALFAGAPVQVFGRYRPDGSGDPPGLVLRAQDGAGRAWEETVAGVEAPWPGALRLGWARGWIQELQDVHAVSREDRVKVYIVQSSLRFGVLSRFTAFVAVDREVVNPGGRLERVEQPRELPSGWEGAGWQGAGDAGVAWRLWRPPRPSPRPAYTPPPQTPRKYRDASAACSISFAKREVILKVVYYGPGHAGKTTSMEHVHRSAPEAERGELTSILTEGDRTLSFDYRSSAFAVGGMHTKLQCYTVPGAVYHDATRKLVLQGAGAVIFVADSQRAKMPENLECYENLEENLRDQGLDPRRMVLVFQWNKRDVLDPIPVADLNRELNRYGSPTFETVARQGQGVLEALTCVQEWMYESLNKEYGLAPAGAPPPKVVRSAAAARQPTPSAPGRGGPAEAQAGLKPVRGGGSLVIRRRVRPALPSPGQAGSSSLASAAPPGGRRTGFFGRVWRSLFGADDPWKAKVDDFVQRLEAAADAAELDPHRELPPLLGLLTDLILALERSGQRRDWLPALNEVRSALREARAATPSAARQACQSACETLAQLTGVP